MPSTNNEERQKKNDLRGGVRELRLLRVQAKGTIRAAAVRGILYLQIMEDDDFLFQPLATYYSYDDGDDDI